MTRYGKLFLYFIVLSALAWILPWLYGFVTPDTRSAPFTLLSEVNDQFLNNLPIQDKGSLAMVDQDGRIYTKNEIDSMLPCFYYRQLLSDGRLPDSLRGRSMSPRDIQNGNFILRFSPRDINRRPAGLYPLLESRSGRVDLEMPSDVFRITDQGIRFIDMETNRIDEKKSRVFTQAMEKKGFVFPAVEIAGNPTTRKEYDNGYLLIDQNRRVFRLMMVKGRPFVRETGIDPSLGMQHAFVVEPRGRQYFGMLTDREHRFYVLDSQYRLTRVPVEHFDPERQGMTLIGNPFNRTIRIDGSDTVRWYGIAADDSTLIARREQSFPPTVSQRIAEYIFPFTLSFTSPYDNYVYPRIDAFSLRALILNVLLAALFIVSRGRKAGAVPAAVTLLTGVYGFLAIVLLGLSPRRK